jgi:hypothetical protein
MSLTSELLPGVPPVESPLFAQSLDQMGLDDHERLIARSLHDKGYAVIDFPDPDICARIERIKTHLAPHFAIDLSDPTSIKTHGDNRIQDAWQFNPDVKAIATNATLLALLSRLYGRRAIPFQTLNFPVGTQQHLHSDSIHFSSVPERFMCGVWLAMEDVHDDAGPLEYCPGSHKWPIVSNVAVGRDRWNDRSSNAQAPYEPLWRELVSASGLGTERFAARKGQALIWAANLLHGGSRQEDPTRTRWSQVSHYYFADCIYYTPAYSDEPLGRLDTRSIVDIGSAEIEPNRHMQQLLPVAPAKPAPKKSAIRRIGEAFGLL